MCTVCLIANIVGLIASIGCLCGIYLLAKNNNTFNKRNKILDAIYRYNISYYDFDKEISYSCLESYEKTLYRLYDWGYSRIVPKEILEQLKPFIM